jgi:outer membrane protein assembly factor BamB
MRRIAGFTVAALASAAFSWAATSEASAAWALPGATLSGTRAVAGPGLSAGNVGRMRVSWRFRPSGPLERYGLFATTPLIDHGTVYVEDLRSNVSAINQATGKVRWTKRFNAINDGPNGLALGAGRVYGATDNAAFALSPSTGRVLWTRFLTSASQQFVDVAPVYWHGLVIVSTVGFDPLGRGVIYALDARTGAVRWRFQTVQHPWLHPWEAGGGGIWYPVSIDAEGRLYAGISNPQPWGGSPKLPILATVDGAPMVFGAGKAGLVIAWNRNTRRRVWTTPVGLQRNNVGPLPRRQVTVCPGIFGGVLTPMAYGEGRLFVPDVDLCNPGSATTSQNVDKLDPTRGRGRLVSIDARTGRILWDHRFPSPDFGCATVSNDVVFTATYAGTVYALASATGRVLWSAKLPERINGCPAVVGGTLLVEAGVPKRPGDRPQMVAFKVP